MAYNSLTNTFKKYFGKKRMWKISKNSPKQAQSYNLFSGSEVGKQAASFGTEL